MRRLVALIALLLSATAASAYRANVDGWEVFNFATKETGRDVVGCMSGRPYQDGTRLSFVITTEYTWAVGVANNAWVPQQGAGAITVYVDRKLIASGKGFALDPKTILLPLSGIEPFRALQMGRRLDLQSPHGSLSFILDGSAKAM
jgi:hypothetical protein